jgi:hypothetical protein
MNDGVRELPEPIEFLESLRQVRASMRIRFGRAHLSWGRRLHRY